MDRDRRTQGRSTLDFTPGAASAAQIFDGAALLQTEKAEAGVAPSSLAISEEEKPSAETCRAEEESIDRGLGFVVCAKQSKSHRESHLCHEYANGENDEELPFSH